MAKSQFPVEEKAKFTNTEQMFSKEAAKSVSVFVVCSNKMNLGLPALVVFYWKHDKKQKD